MSVLGEILEKLRSGCTSFETYGRHGDVIRKLSSDQFVSTVAAYRRAFRGWSTTSYQGHRVVALLFRPEETIEFLVATFAAIAEGLTVVPFYPNWDSETQFLHLKHLAIVIEGMGNVISASPLLSPILDHVRHGKQFDSFIRLVTFDVRVGNPTSSDYSNTNRSVSFSLSQDKLLSLIDAPSHKTILIDFNRILLLILLLISCGGPKSI